LTIRTNQGTNALSAESTELRLWIVCGFEVEEDFGKLLGLGAGADV